MNHSGNDIDIVGATIVAAGSLIVGGQVRVDELLSTQGDFEITNSIIADWYIGDGERAEIDDVVCKVIGPLHAIRACEDNAINLLQLLSSGQTEIDTPLFSMRYKID